MPHHFLIKRKQVWDTLTVFAKNLIGMDMLVFPWKNARLSVILFLFCIAGTSASDKTGTYCIFRETDGRLVSKVGLKFRAEFKMNICYVYNF